MMEIKTIRQLVLEPYALDSKWVSVDSLFLVIEKYRDYGNGDLESFREVLLKEVESKEKRC